MEAANDSHQTDTSTWRHQGLFGHMPGQGRTQSGRQRNKTYSQKPESYTRRRTEQESQVNYSQQKVRGQQVMSGREAERETRQTHWLSRPVTNALSDAWHEAKFVYGTAKMVVGLPLDLERAQGHVFADKDLQSAINRGYNTPTPGLRDYLERDSATARVEVWRDTAELGVGIASGYGIGKGLEIGVGIAASRFALFVGRGPESLAKFASRDLLESHFIKHGAEFKGAFNTADEYLSGAHDVIQNGIKVAYDYNGETRIGYIRFAGTTQGKTLFADIKQPGLSKFEFVGTNNSGKITTYHIERGRNAFWKMLNNSVIKNITPFNFVDDDLEILSQNNLKQGMWP